MNFQATQQLSGTAAETASPRVASTSRAVHMNADRLGTCAYPWPVTFGGNPPGMNGTMLIERSVIATPKHRLRRPEDRSH